MWRGRGQSSPPGEQELPVPLQGRQKKQFSTEEMYTEKAFLISQKQMASLTAQVHLDFCPTTHLCHHYLTTNREAAV